MIHESLNGLHISIGYGQVTAAKRPPNSALEVDLDFEHNVRPAPPITEEVTLAIEDMIRKRIEQVNNICVRYIAEMCFHLISSKFSHFLFSVF